MKSLYDKAVNHIEFGELDEAEEALHTYLMENPTDALAHNKLGVVFARRSNLVEARRCFEEALKHDRFLVHALNNLGNIARDEGKLELAIEYYQKSITLDPDFALPHNNLGVVYKQLNRYGDFIREIKIAKRLHNRKNLGTTEKLNIRDQLITVWDKLRNKRN